MFRLENPTQLNTESTKKRKRQSKDSSITDSIPFHSGFPDVTAQKRTEAKESFERYQDLILENIDYDVLASDPHVDREQLDEIVDLVQERGYRIDTQFFKSQLTSEDKYILNKSRFSYCAILGMVRRLTNGG